MTSGRRLGAATLLSCVALVTTADADTCCYSVCGAAPALTQVGLLVTCVPEHAGCPRGMGACGVWAERNMGVRCSDPRTCDAGTHGGREAEALLGRLVADPTFHVVRPVEFLLSNGTWLGFRPSK